MDEEVAPALVAIYGLAGVHVVMNKTLLLSHRKSRNVKKHPVRGTGRTFLLKNNSSWATYINSIYNSVQFRQKKSLMLFIWSQKQHPTMFFNRASRPDEWSPSKWLWETPYPAFPIQTSLTVDRVYVMTLNYCCAYVARKGWAGR